MDGIVTAILCYGLHQHPEIVTDSVLCRNVLRDYARGEFKREINLLYEVVKAGIPERLQQESVYTDLNIKLHAKSMLNHHALDQSAVEDAIRSWVESLQYFQKSGGRWDGPPPDPFQILEVVPDLTIWELVSLIPQSIQCDLSVISKDPQIAQENFVASFRLFADWVTKHAVVLVEKSIAQSEKYLRTQMENIRTHGPILWESLSHQVPKTLAGTTLGVLVSLPVILLFIIFQDISLLSVVTFICLMAVVGATGWSVGLKTVSSGLQGVIQVFATIVILGAVPGLLTGLSAHIVGGSFWGMVVGSIIGSASMGAAIYVLNREPDILIIFSSIGAILGFVIGAFHSPLLGACIGAAVIYTLWSIMWLREGVPLR